MATETKKKLATYGKIGGAMLIGIGGMMLLTSDGMRPEMKKSGLTLAVIQLVIGIALFKYSSNYISTNYPIPIPTPNTV